MGREKRRENEDGEQEKMNKKGSKNRPSNSPIFHGKGTRIGGNRQGARVCAGSEAREHTHTHRHREREREDWGGRNNRGVGKGKLEHDWNGWRENDQCEKKRAHLGD